MSFGIRRLRCGSGCQLGLQQDVSWAMSLRQATRNAPGLRLSIKRRDQSERHSRAMGVVTIAVAFPPRAPHVDDNDFVGRRKKRNWYWRRRRGHSGIVVLMNFAVTILCDTVNSCSCDRSLHQYSDHLMRNNLKIANKINENKNTSGQRIWRKVASHFVPLLSTEWSFLLRTPQLMPLLIFAAV